MSTVASPTPPAAPCTSSVSPGSQPSALQGVVGGRIVGAEGGSRFEADRIGQLDDAAGRLHRFLGEAATAQHSIADLQSFDVGTQLQDLAGGLATWDERRLGLDVVLPGDPQHVGKAHARGTQAYLDLAWSGDGESTDLTTSLSGPP